MVENRGNTRQVPEYLEALPLFPLPGTVFFPNTLLPLYVFEARYRQMTEHALEGDGLLAVVLRRDEEERDQLLDLFTVAGLGRIVHHERLPDGRFHILLQGLARVELSEELSSPELLYRRAKARVVAEPPVDDEALGRELATLKACYAKVLDTCPTAREQLGELTRRIVDPGVLADVICATVLEDPCTRQAALEDHCVVGRLRKANDALASLLLGNMTHSALVH